MEGPVCDVRHLFRLEVASDSYYKRRNLMDDRRMETAAMLLDKARSTGFEPEACSFVEKCRQLLSEVLATYGRSSNGSAPTHGVAHIDVLA
jgi:hypothetical protein